MKRYLFLLFCMVTIFSLTACGSSSSQVQKDSLAAEPAMKQSTTDITEIVPSTEDSEPTDADASLTAQPESELAEAMPVTKPSANLAISSEQEPTPSGETAPMPSTPDANQQEAEAETESSKVEEDTDMKLNVQVGGSNFTATLESNTAVDAFVELMQNVPVVISMSDYSGFEKVGTLGTSLPTANRQITTESGDIVLYGGNQIVIFYGSNSWSYTQLAHIDDLTGWAEALGSGDITVTFTLE